jgi:hypothetical protein
MAGKDVERSVAQCDGGCSFCPASVLSLHGPRSKRDGLSLLQYVYFNRIDF